MLIDILKKYLKRHGHMNLATYMELCLQHPEFGYYKTQTAIGELDQDFITAPELSSLFGEIIACWAIDQMRQQDFSFHSPIHLIELGPGKGTLMKDILKIFQHFLPETPLHIFFYEINPMLQIHQTQMMESEYPKLSFTHLEDIHALPSGQNFIFSNEFFDALPIRSFYHHQGNFLEQIIQLDPASEALQLTLHPSSNALSLALDQAYPQAKAQDIVEISPYAESFIQHLANHATENKTLGFMCDYGYFEPNFKSSLRAIKSHQFVDLFETPGETDLSAFVNFNNFKQILDQAQISYQAHTQAEFLIQNGAKNRLKPLDHATTHLLMSPHEMGESFKVLTFHS